MKVVDLNVRPDARIHGDPEAPRFQGTLVDDRIEDVYFPVGGWYRDKYEALPRPTENIEMDWVEFVPKLPKLVGHLPSPKKVLNTLEQYDNPDTPEKDRECIARFAHSIFYSQLVRIGNIDTEDPRPLIWRVPDDLAVEKATQIVKNQQREQAND